MKKLMLVLMTGLFVLGLTSCEEKKDQKKPSKYPKKERQARRW